MHSSVELGGGDGSCDEIGGYSFGAGASVSVSSRATMGGGTPSTSDPLDLITSGTFDPRTNTVTLDGAGQWAGRWLYFQPPHDLLVKLGLPIPGQGPIEGWYEVQLANALSAVANQKVGTVTFTIANGDYAPFVATIAQSSLTPALAQQWAAVAPMLTASLSMLRSRSVNLSAASSSLVTAPRAPAAAPSSTMALAPLSSSPKWIQQALAPSSTGKTVLGVGALATVAFLAWQVMR